MCPHDTMDQLRLSITFDEASTAEASRNASDLQRALSDASRDLKVTRVRQNSDEQNLGTILEIVLNSSAVVVLAGALYAWARRNNRSSFKLKDGNLELTATDIRSSDAAAIADKVFKWAGRKG